MLKALYENLFVKPMTASSINAHLQRGELQVALEKANRLIEMDANNAEFYRMRAEVKYQAGDIKGALADCDASLNRSSDDENKCRCYIIRGQCRLKLGEKSLAIADFGRAISTSTLRSLPAFIERGKLHAEEGNFAQAIEDFSTALRFEVTAGMQTKMHVRMLRGDVHLHLGNLSEATQDYEKARYYSNANVNVNQTLAKLYHQQGMTAKAIDVLQTSMRTDPRNADTYRAVLAEIDPDQDKAFVPLESGGALNSGALSSGARDSGTVTREAINDDDGDRVIIPDRAPDRAPDVPPTQSERRQHPTQRGLFERDQEDAEKRQPSKSPKAQSKQENQPAPLFPKIDLEGTLSPMALNAFRSQHSTRAYNFAIQGDLNRALKEIDKALTENSRNPQDHILRGNICLGLARYDGALASFRTVQRLKTSKKAHITSGMAGEALTLLHLGDKEDARRKWQELVEFDGAFDNLYTAQARLEWADASMNMIREMLGK